MQASHRHQAAEEVIYSQSAKAEGPREIGNPTGAFVYPKNVLPYYLHEVNLFMWNPKSNVGVAPQVTPRIACGVSFIQRRGEGSPPTPA